MLMEKQTLLEPQVREEPRKTLLGVIVGVLVVLCAVLTATIAWYHWSMQPKGMEHTVHLFAVTRDVKAIAADFTGEIQGRLLLQPAHHSILITGTLTKLVPGYAHGLHILSLIPEDGVDRNQLHWDINSGVHGCPGETEGYHTGDLGNVVGDEQGQAEVRILTNAFSLVEALGRVMVVTENKDLCTEASEGRILASAALAAAQPPSDNPDFLASK